MKELHWKILISFDFNFSINSRIYQPLQTFPLPAHAVSRIRFPAEPEVVLNQTRRAFFTFWNMCFNKLFRGMTFRLFRCEIKKKKRKNLEGVSGTCGDKLSWMAMEESFLINFPFFFFNREKNQMQNGVWIKYWKLLKC